MVFNLNVMDLTIAINSLYTSFSRKKILFT